MWQGNGGEEKILALENLVRINNMAVTEMEKREQMKDISEAESPGP